MLGGVGSIFPTVHTLGQRRRGRRAPNPQAELLFTRASLGIESAALEGATLMAMNHHIKKVI